MTGETLIPLNWLFYVAAVLITAFIWWLRNEFAKNDSQHKAAASNLRKVHDRIDYLILHIFPHKPYPHHEDD